MMTGTVVDSHPHLTGTSAPDVPSSDTRGTRKDVWSRSGSRYRVRAIVLLVLNVLLFAGVGSFAFWLRTGERFAPIVEGYPDLMAQTFSSVRIMGYSGVSLGALLLAPISVQDVPLQIPIVGLLMAALISIPILVSILYRFWSSLPFIAVVGFLAVMPWLAVTLLGSCIIASVRPFRHHYRFMSALLGLLPAVVYLMLAWSGTAEDVVGKIDPVDRIKFIAPWVLAIVAAATAFAVVLTIAKIVDYRPGAIAPLLAIMFGLPVAMFEFYVGRDELYYRLLEASSESHFADVDASEPLERAIAHAWERRTPPRGSRQAVRDVVETQWLFGLTSELQPLRSALTIHQAELTARCDWFLRYFPDSRYAPSALYIKARALDTRVDADEFRRNRWIRYYNDFPSVASLTSWRMVLANSPDTILGAAALLRLAQLDAREGDVERAISKLGPLLGRFGTDADQGGIAGSGALTRGLTRDSPEVNLGIPRHRILLEAIRLHDLLTANRDPLYGYEPLCGSRRVEVPLRFGLLELVPRRSDYVANLIAIKARYPNCQLEDNLDLEIAKASASPTEMIERLEACLDRFPDRDAAPEALFRLGVAYKDHDRSELSRRAFQRLLTDFPNSIWARQAARYSPRPKLIQVSEAVRP